MRNLKLFSLSLILCLIMGLGSACASQPSVTEVDTKGETTKAPVESTQQEMEAPTEAFDDGSISGLPSPFSFDSLAGLKGEEWANAAAEKNAAAAAAYQAKRFTTASGVTVQRVPNDPRAYNVAVLDADNRGCNNCHDLHTMLEMLPMSHPQLENPYDSYDLSVEMCFTCHVTYQVVGVELADAMHALHMRSEYFDEMGGNCLSCHHINGDTGEYELWDRAKFTVMRGITTVAADAAKVETSFNQTEITPVEDVYLYWEGPGRTGIPQMFDTSDESLANWTIQVTGDIPEAVTVNWKEFMDKHAECVVKEVRMLDCQVNGTGANQVAQVEVTGIPATCLLEEVGYVAKEGLYPQFATVGSDTWPITMAVDEGTLFVYELNGEPMSAIQGFPMQIWQDGGTASQFPKSVVSIDITSVETPKAKGGAAREVNSGIFNYRDGQVFQMGDEIVFEGYANNPLVGVGISKVEYSLDLGATWIEMDTTEADTERYVYWYFKFEPQTIGSYVLQVRATDDNGQVQSVVIQSLFHVE